MKSLWLPYGRSRNCCAPRKCDFSRAGHKLIHTTKEMQFAVQKSLWITLIREFAPGPGFWTVSTAKLNSMPFGVYFWGLWLTAMPIPRKCSVMQEWECSQFVCVSGPVRTQLQIIVYVYVLFQRGLRKCVCVCVFWMRSARVLIILEWIELLRQAKLISLLFYPHEMRFLHKLLYFANIMIALKAIFPSACHLM